MSCFFSLFAAAVVTNPQSFIHTQKDVQLLYVVRATVAFSLQGDRQRQRQRQGGMDTDLENAPIILRQPELGPSSEERLCLYFMYLTLTEVPFRKSDMRM